MGIDLTALSSAVKAHGTVTRVVIAGIAGSCPREVGASMLVWDSGQSGTIGGGALEFEMTLRARQGHYGLSHHALGPELGQCCGGAVQILTERYNASTLPQPDSEIIARPCSGTLSTKSTAQGCGAAVPLTVQRLIARARGGHTTLAPRLIDGWFIEPVAQPDRTLWIWGAGHVGRAIVSAMAPLPAFAITWVDTGPERFPEDVPAQVRCVPASDPALLVPHAPLRAEHLILTYSHALDLELCHRLLGHGFNFAGLIGSKSKWARFRNRLSALGHTDQQIQRITCPIGDPSLGKHPSAIAIGVAHSLVLPGRTALRKGLTA